jgi:hypothetical protein
VRRCLALLAAAVLFGCAEQPRLDETMWVTVARVYSPEDLQKSWNTGLAARVKAAGLNDADVAAGRVLRVACGLGTDDTWVSYAYLPLGMNVRRDEVLELRFDDRSDRSGFGWNPVIGRVEEFRFPGALRAYAWKERGASADLERAPVEPEQRGRYFIAHGDYVIKCRQDDKYHQ